MPIVGSLPYNLTNGTTADASQVMANFDQILNNVNTNAAPSTDPILTGGTADNMIIGGTTPNSGKFTTLDATSVGSVLKNLVLESVYPVGSLYFNTSNATNPASLLGFGTWAAFAAGRVPIGVGTGTDINSNTLTVTAGGTGGEYTHQLTTSEIPSHNHTLTDPGHFHAGATLVAASDPGAPFNQAGTHSTSNPTYNGPPYPSNVSTDTRTTGITIASTGSDGFHNNIQPYIGVYIWQRTA
ncbi:MAG: hypothetical protein KGL39_11710 [Patescibacteria group bacterium]|nr:hypothetical protein [Patescibacteria group bacterium]